MKRIQSLLKSWKFWIIVCVVLGGSAVAYVVMHKKQSAKKPSTPTAVQGAVVTESTFTPSEEQPDKKTFAWAGDVDDPKYITLSSIGIGGYVQKVGIDQVQAIAVPNNIYMAGWYVDSVQPGKPGLSVIDGHVDGVTKNDAIFGRLKDMKIGDEIQVELGSGVVKKYHVISTQTVATSEAVNYLFSQQPNVKSQLNLITCTGTFDKTAKSYDKRVIVSAALVE